MSLQKSPVLVAVVVFFLVALGLIYQRSTASFSETLELRRKLAEVTRDRDALKERVIAAEKVKCPEQKSCVPCPQRKCPEVGATPHAPPTRNWPAWRYWSNDPYYAQFHISAGADLPPFPAPKIVHHQSPSLDWPMTMLPRCRHHIYAQGKQDGMLLCLFAAINTTNKFFVEFGHDNIYEANSASLYFLGWRGLFMDGANNNAQYNCHAHVLKPDNIASILEQHGVPKSFDYLSADLDSIELLVVEAILKAGYRPRVWSIEYNCNAPFRRNVTMSFDVGHRWNGLDCNFGLTLGAAVFLAEQWDYKFVGVDFALDAFFVDSSLLHPDTELPDLEDPRLQQWYGCGNGKGDTSLHHCPGGWEEKSKGAPYFDIRDRMRRKP